MKIVTIVGARPQFIKTAPVWRALSKYSDIEHVLVHTGQHFDELMSEVFFAEMQLPAPHHNLGIGGLSHGAMTGRMLEALEAVLLAEKPDCALVFGDTNSTLAGALAAAKLHIPVAHIEAGLRSFNMAMPEEINRRVVDHISALLFAPTPTAVENLRREGIVEGVHQVGDVMYDAALQFLDVAHRQSRILDRLELQPGEYVLATAHRAENTDDPARLQSIFGALAELAEGIFVVVPLHPRTARMLSELGFRAPPSMNLIEPTGFLDMMMLEKHASMIATDSGGVQKEAYFYGVPCVTLRDETEWVELVEAGANRLAPPFNKGMVLEALRDALHKGRRETPKSGLYGDGRASERIADIVSDHFHIAG